MSAHDLSNTRVLVTGATSGLGRNAAIWLQEQGCEVIGLGRDLEAGQALEALGIRFVACDLADAEISVLDRLQKRIDAVDWVWHCAALSSPWGAWEDFYRMNAQATRLLAEAAAKAGVKRFVHISTPSIYFDFQHHKALEESYQARVFANYYASSKAMAEAAIHEAQQRYPQTRFTILRPRAIFGPFDRVILPRLLEQIAHHRGVLKLPRAGRTWLDVTFVLNVVHAMFLASTRADLPPAAVYNITNQEPVYLCEMIDRLLKQHMGMSFEIRAVPYPVLHAAAFFMEKLACLTGKEPMLTRYSAGALNFDMTLSTSRAQTELGYEAPYKMQEAIALTAAWLKQQPNFVAGGLDG